MCAFLRIIRFQQRAAVFGLLQPGDGFEFRAVGIGIYDLIKSLYRETQSGNVFAFWDMPTNSAGYEEGPKSAFNMVADAVTDWDWEYAGMILLINVTWDDRNYGNFTKDW